jgi:hypothetical protein
MFKRKQCNYFVTGFIALAKYLYLPNIKQGTRKNTSKYRTISSTSTLHFQTNHRSWTVEGGSDPNSNQASASSAGGGSSDWKAASSGSSDPDSNQAAMASAGGGGPG